MKRENLKINEPCTENWDAMGDREGAARFCDKCTKNVHNISDMTRDEATEFLAAHQHSDLCVVYKFNSNTEQVVFREQGPSRAQLAGLKKLLAAAAMVPMLAGCDTTPDVAPCDVDSDEIRPIDLIQEQEAHFMEFFSDLFEGPREQMVGAIAPVEVMGEPSVQMPVEPSVDVRPVEHVEVEPVDHQLREELDGESDPPIRRLMGKVAPTRMPQPPEQKVEKPHYEEVMGGLEANF